MASLWCDRKSGQRLGPEDSIWFRMNDACGEYVGFLRNPCFETEIEHGEECVVIALCHGLDYEDGRQQPQVEVLWITWEGDVAYRRGTGQIPLSKWTALDAKEVEIVLG